MHPGFAVDVDALESVGAQVEATAAMLRESVRVAGAGLAPSSPPGSAAVAAAQGAEQAWLAELRRSTLSAVSGLPTETIARPSPSLENPTRYDAGRSGSCSHRSTFEGAVTWRIGE